MTITLELPAEFEAQLRQEADRADLDTKGYILETLRERLRLSRVPHLSKTESDLLQEINQGMPETDWQRYNELIAKRQAETITAHELDELIGISEEREEANARRMENLVALARLRRQSLDTVMKDLGIQAPSYA